MHGIEGALYRNGCDQTLLADFRAVAETGRYPASARAAPQQTTLGKLALFVGGEGGKRRDLPLYHLCHFVRALAALQVESGPRDQRMELLLGIEKATSGALRRALEQLHAASGWRRPGFLLADGGLRIVDGGAGGLMLSYGRLPLLVAVYELLCTIELDGELFYFRLNDILGRMLQDDAGEVSVRSATNELAAAMRRYRSAHLARSVVDEKINAIASFLNERAVGQAWEISDVQLLDFWRLHSLGQGLRVVEYETVFEYFLAFLKVLDASAAAAALESAGFVSPAREAETPRRPGEAFEDDWDYSDERETTAGLGEWHDPLVALDAPGLRDIKLFKDRSERRPIERLMRHGPAACRLILSLLRLESFGPVQAGISNALRIPARRASVAQRLSCHDASAYPAIRSDYARVLAHVRRLQRAVLLALAPEISEESASVRPAFEQARADDVLEVTAEQKEEALRDAKAAFEGIRRKGFEPLDTDDEARREAFAMAAELLVAVGTQLERALEGIVEVGAAEEDLTQAFVADRAIFSDQFERIYG